MLATPLKLGPVPLATNLLLAPIAGYCDLAFRTVCREWGGVGLACTDLLSPQGLLRGTATSLDLAKTNDFDKPVGMQLYGSDPDTMAQGARWAVEHGATVVDINMGCPVDKVTKKDGGSKLLTNIEHAVALAARVVKELEKCPIAPDEWRRRLGTTPPLSGRGQGGGPSSPFLSSLSPLRGEVASLRAGEGSSPFPNSPTPIPLTCKIRLCWSTSDYDAGLACSPHLARMLADVGVVAVTVHGRTTEDKFQGSVRREGIARVVEAVNGQIPIIGNGDVREPEDAAAMIRDTGCQGVMIGRGALSTPWLFRDAWHYLQTGQKLPAPTEPEMIATVRRFFDLMLEQRDQRYAMFQIRRRISWFAKRLQRQLDNGKVESVKPLKEAVRTAATPSDIHTILDRFLAGELRGGWFEMEEAEQA